MDPLSKKASVLSIPSEGLILQDLRVDYGAFTAVDGVSFSIAPGEIFGLVGPNGAGKTSTIKALATLLVPTYGEIRMFGTDVLEEPDEVHSMIGYMPDLAPIIGDLKVWEFVDHFAAAYGWEKATRSARVEECLRMVDMWDSRNTFGKNLSRGMTQRVVLAKTLLPNPRLLLLDEPASGMDPIARIQLKDIMQHLSRQGVIVLISSHILTELSDMCSSVGIMHKGKMRYVGPIDEINETMTGNASRAIQVEVLADQQVQMEEFLSGTDKVTEWVKQSDTVFDLVFIGDDAGQAELLKQLLSAGIGVVAFTRKSSLETAMKSLAIEK